MATLKQKISVVPWLADVEAYMVTYPAMYYRWWPHNQNQTVGQGYYRALVPGIAPLNTAQYCIEHADRTADRTAAPEPR